MLDILKMLVGQRSMWGAALAMLAIYLGLDPDTPKLEAALQAAGGGGVAALVAQVTYWVQVPRAALLKILAGATPIVYAVMQALGSDERESAQIAELVGGLAGALVIWSGLQPNTVARPENPKLASRNP